MEKIVLFVVLAKSLDDRLKQDWLRPILKIANGWFWLLFTNLKFVGKTQWSLDLIVDKKVCGSNLATQFFFVKSKPNPLKRAIT
jgi:hypothetical protein